MDKNRGIVNIIILTTLVALIIGIILVYKNQIPNQSQVPNNSPNPNSQELKSFQSKIMKFSAKIPREYKTVEESGKITITMSNGKIYLDRNGTNFGNLNDYLNDLDAHNKPQILEDTRKIINGYQTSFRLLKFSSGENQRTVIIFVDNWVYNIYTNNLPLYADLDQIAQSFRYIP